MIPANIHATSTESHRIKSIIIKAATIEINNEKNPGNMNTLKVLASVKRFLSLLAHFSFTCMICKKNNKNIIIILTGIIEDSILKIKLVISSQ